MYRSGDVVILSHTNCCLFLFTDRSPGSWGILHGIWWSALPTETLVKEGLPPWIKKKQFEPCKGVPSTWSRCMLYKNWWLVISHKKVIGIQRLGYFQGKYACISFRINKRWNITGMNSTSFSPTCPPERRENPGNDVGIKSPGFRATKIGAAGHAREDSRSSCFFFFLTGFQLHGLKKMTHLNCVYNWHN